MPSAPRRRPPNLDPILRVFVGCAPNWSDAESQAVLEHSIRSRTTQPVEITWMIASRDPCSLWGGWNMSRWATPFSGFRWSVPHACEFEGRAIYMDSDTIVLGDIAELWRRELPAGAVAAARSPSKFCVTLWDCRAAKDHLLHIEELRGAAGHERQVAYFERHPVLVDSFGAEWNWLDAQDPEPFGKVVHYTDLTTQPHLPHALSRLVGTGRRHWYDGPMRPHPRRELVTLFEDEYRAARKAGYDCERYLPEQDFGEVKKRAMTNYQAVR
jgi:hypothetical protein